MRQAVDKRYRSFQFALLGFDMLCQDINAGIKVQELLGDRLNPGPIWSGSDDNSSSWFPVPVSVP